MRRAILELLVLVITPCGDSRPQSAIKYTATPGLLKELWDRYACLDGGHALQTKA